MIRTGIALSAALLGALLSHNALSLEVPLRGFDAATVQKFGETRNAPLAADQRRRLNRLVKTAVDFRTWMAGVPEKLAAALTVPERAILAALMSPDDPRDVARWRYFFRGSIVTLGHALSDKPRVGFYNPIVDGWVLADFVRSSDGGMRLDALRVVAGDRIASAPGRADDARPPWLLRSDVPLPTALSVATGANIAAFERAYPPLSAADIESTPPADDPLIERRLELVGITIGTFVADGAYNRVAEQILDAIEVNDTAALARLTGPSMDQVAPLQRISSLSAPARRTFELRGSFRRSDGMTIALGSPYSGKWMIFADLDTSVDDRPRLTDVLVVDLGQLN